MLGAEIVIVCLLVIGTVVLVLASQPEGGTKKAWGELNQAKVGIPLTQVTPTYSMMGDGRLSQDPC